MQFFTWPLITAIIILTISFTVLFSNLSINMKFIRENNINNLDVTFRILFISFKKSFAPETGTGKKKKAEQKPAEPEEQELTGKSKTLREGAEALLSPGIKRYRGLVQIFLRHTIWHRLNAGIVIGLKDSFATGLGAGIAWAAGGNLISVLKRNLRFSDSSPNLHIYPDFKGGGVALDIDAAFSVRVFYLALMLFKALQTVFIVKSEAR